MKGFISTILLPLCILQFMTSCEDSSLINKYKKGYRDPALIGKWEDPDMPIGKESEGNVYGFIFHANGKMDWLYVMQKEGTYIVSPHIFDMKYYTKDGLIYQLQVGDGFKVSTNEREPLRYRIVQDKLYISEVGKSGYKRVK